MHTQPPNPSRHRREPSWRCRLVPLAAVILALSGCRAVTRSPYDQIEAELRTRERELAETRAELQNARLLNEAYGRTPRGIETGAGPAAPFLPLKEVALASGTGGVDDDGRPGDEALQVVLVPRDSDGSAVKVPGRVTVLAYDVATNGIKTPIGRWDIEPDTLHRHWRGGLFATGFYLKLQWDRLPAHERVRLQARLQTLDGRAYEADREVTVRVVPGGAANENCLPGLPAPWIPPPLVPAVPPAIDVLPPPTVVRESRPVTIAPARPGGR